MGLNVSPLLLACVFSQSTCCSLRCLADTNGSSFDELAIKVVLINSTVNIFLYIFGLATF